MLATPTAWQVSLSRIAGPSKGLNDRGCDCLLDGPSNARQWSCHIPGQVEHTFAERRCVWQALNDLQSTSTPFILLDFPKSPGTQRKADTIIRISQKGKSGSSWLLCPLSFKDYNGLVLPSWKRTQLNSAHWYWLWCTSLFKSQNRQFLY